MAEVEIVDENRRKLAEDERRALLERPLVGVFSTISAGGWIHSVPVFYTYTEGELRVLAGTQAVKTRNVVRTGQATLCVETVDGPVRSFVTASGTASVRQPPTVDELRALDERYSRTDFASGWDESAFAASCMLIIRPNRWIAWCDWD